MYQDKKLQNVYIVHIGIRCDDMKKTYLYTAILAVVIVVGGVAIYSQVSPSDEQETKEAVVTEISKRMDLLEDGPMVIVISDDGDEETYLVTLENGEVVVKDSDKNTVAYTFDAKMFSK